MSLKYPGISPISAEKIYSEFTEILRADDNLEEVVLNPVFSDYFFKDAAKIDNAMEIARKQLTINLPEKPKKEALINELPKIDILFKSEDPNFAYLFLNEFIKMTVLKTKDRILANKKQEINFLVKNNEQLIKLENARIDAENSSILSRLKEQFDQANVLGIETPIDQLNYAKTNNAITKPENNAITKPELTNKNPQGYWLGTKILKAEMDMLHSRENNIPFSQVLRDLISENAKYKDALAHLNAAEFDVFNVVSSPRIPTHPESSKKSLILAVAGVLGLMLGVFIALIRRAVKHRRQGVY